MRFRSAVVGGGGEVDQTRLCAFVNGQRLICPLDRVAMTVQTWLLV